MSEFGTLRDEYHAGIADGPAVKICKEEAYKERNRRYNEMDNFENDVRYFTKAITGFKDAHEHLLGMEKDLYRNYLNKKGFDLRSVMGELNMGLLTDILTEEYLDSDKEDLLLTIVVRFAEDVIKDVSNGEEVWEAASAYDFTNVVKAIRNSMGSNITSDELTKYLYSGFTSRIFMAITITDDLPIDFYSCAIRDEVLTLQELLIVVYIMDNIGMSIGPNTTKILLELVNTEDLYMVSDYPLIESIKNFAIVVLKGKVDTEQ